MDEYNYWVRLDSIILSLLIASLSLNSVTWIKDKFNKILAFFVFTGLYSLILSYFFERSSIGYTQQEFLPTFIYKGYNSHIFQGSIYLLITFLIFIILLIRLFLKKNNIFKL